MNTIQSFSEDLLLAGYSVLPVNEDKRPAIPSWTALQSKQMEQLQAERAFKSAWGVAVVCGAVSGGLECIDFDAHDKNIEHVFNVWRADSGIEDIITRNRLYIERSKRGGFHVLYRYDAPTFDGSQKLANWEGGESMIETKGEGGYLIVAPTPGYNVIANTLEELQPITIDERDYLLSWAKQFNQGKAAATSEEAKVAGHDYTDPVSWFNWHKASYAKQLMKEKGWTLVSQTKEAEEWRRPGKTDGISATWGYRFNALYVFSTSVEQFKFETYYTPFQIVTILRFNRSYNSAQHWIVSKYFEEATPYIRVGTDYFKRIKKTDRYKMLRSELKGWNKEEIKQDHGKQYIENIPKFDDFAILPNNLDFHPVVENCYNLYKEFSHQPEAGVWPWSEVLMQHIFGDQHNLGMRYLQALYLHPERSLPILVLVSKERQTGKTTFLNWLNMIFGDNMVNISPEDLTSSFNHIYSTANIIAVEETLIEKAITVEKIKAIATAKFTTVNQKFVSQYKVPFFGKIILASNNEDKFARIDEEEIRFFVRKVTLPKVHNHNIEANLQAEIPAFLNHLTTLPAIDWTRDRSGFTPDEIANDSLNRVKAESKSGLYKDIGINAEEVFENNPYGIKEFYASPVDIKDAWFKNFSNISLQYIRSVLKNEYNMKPTDKVIAYDPFGKASFNGEKKRGRAYLFSRDRFVDGDDDGAGLVTNSDLENSVTEIVPF